MPIFEYKCDACGEKFEELIQATRTTVPCPRCNSTKTSKMLSVFAATSTGSSPAPACGAPGCGSGFG